MTVNDYKTAASTLDAQRSQRRLTSEELS